MKTFLSLIMLCGHYFILFITLATSQALKAQSLVSRPQAQSLNKGETLYQLKTLYSQTDSLFSPDGVELNLLDGQSFSQIDIEAQLSYGYSKSFDLFGGVKYRANQSNSSNNENDQLTQAGAESFFFGASYQAIRTKKAMANLVFQYRQTLYSNTEYAPGEQPNELVLGDEGSFTRFGFQYSYLMGTKKRWHLDFHGHYILTPSFLSNELNFQARLNLNFKYFGLYGGVQAIVSLNQDEYSDDPDNKPVIAQGISRRFNSINRELSLAQAGVKLRLSPSLLAQLEYQKTLSVNSSDAQTNYLFNLSYFYGGEDPKQKVISRFKEYDFEERIEKVSSNGQFYRVAIGYRSGLFLGQVFDIYQSNYLVKDVLIARSKVVKLKSNYAILKLVDRFKKMPIKVGFLARGSEQ